MNRRKFATTVLGLPLTSAALSSASLAQSSATPTSPQLRTFTHIGKEEQPFLKSAEAQLAWQEGAGYLDHMWFGGGFKGFRALRVRVYVDGETLASIDMELGLGVGVGFQDPTAPWGHRYAGITGSPSGVYLNHRIPYAKSIRVTAELPDGVPDDTVFWWIIRGLENGTPMVCGFELPAPARLKLHKLVNKQVEPLQEFSLADVAGTGMLFQVTMAAQSSNFEFMEGQMRAYMGSDTTPQFLSSGLEDYFLGTYYFNRGLYHLPDAGLTHKDESANSFSAYRYHEDDPVVFNGGMRLACRCGERRGDKTFGTTGKPQSTRYTTYAWIYEW
jgi:hypothetical protein